MSFAPVTVAIAGAERGGAGDVELALTCHAEAEVIPAAGSRAKENPR
jgi:hypothetical protein